MSCNFLLQGIFLDWGLNSCLLYWQVFSLPSKPPGKLHLLLYHLLIFTKISARKALSFPFQRGGNWGLYCWKVLEPGVKHNFGLKACSFLRSRPKFLLQIMPNAWPACPGQTPLVEGTQSMPLAWDPSLLGFKRALSPSYLLFFFLVIFWYLARDPEVASSTCDSLFFCFAPY